MKPQRVEHDDRVPYPGTVPWLTRWVGHARPGARMVAVISGQDTQNVSRDLADWVRALDGAGLIIALWVDASGGIGARQWEWQITRTRRDLPATWPALSMPKAGFAGVPVWSRAVDKRSTDAADAARAKRVLA